MAFDKTALSLQRMTAIGVFLFFAITLVVPSGYSLAAGILLLTSVWMLAGGRRSRVAIPALVLTREDRVLLVTFIAYAVVMMTMTLWLGNRFREIDHPARTLLVIPIFLLLLRVRVDQTVLWAGVIIGAVLSAILSWWQVSIQHLSRASGYINPIHFGEYTLVFSAFCVAGLGWAQTQGRQAARWRVALVLGILCGLCSMVLSGSRGAWVTLPLVLLVLMLFALRHRRHLHARHWAYAGLLITLGIVVLVALFGKSDSMLHQRYVQTVSDVAQYRQQNAQTSVGARLEMWRVAMINLQERPLSGWNMRQYWETLEQLVQSGRASAIVLNYKDNLHNTYIHAWVFFGLPGLLVVLALSGVPLYHFARSLRDPDPAASAIALCGTVFVIAYLGFHLTQSMLMHNTGIMFFLLVLVILWSALRHARTAQPHA